MPTDLTKGELLRLSRSASPDTSRSRLAVDLLRSPEMQPSLRRGGAHGLPESHGVPKGGYLTRRHLCAVAHSLGHTDAGGTRKRQELLNMIRQRLRQQAAAQKAHPSGAGGAARPARPPAVTSSPSAVDLGGQKLLDVCRQLPDMERAFREGDYAISAAGVRRIGGGKKASKASKTVELDFGGGWCIRYNPDRDFIAKGTYAAVYRATRHDLRDPSRREKAYTRVVVKCNFEPDDEGDFVETLVHAELFCELRRSEWHGFWHQLAVRKELPIGCKQPFIPKLLAFGVTDVGRSLTVMQQVDCTLCKYAKTASKEGMRQALVQVATLLEYLQDRFEFMHRDLHTSNVGVIVPHITNARTGRSKLDWEAQPKVCLIDFGMARMVVNRGDGELSIGFAEKHVWRRQNAFNPTLDLAVLTLSLLEFSPRVGGLLPVLTETAKLLDDKVKRSANNKKVWGDLARHVGGDYRRLKPKDRPPKFHALYRHLPEMEWFRPATFRKTLLTGQV
jgi:hypothetical protein